MLPMKQHGNPCLTLEMLRKSYKNLKRQELGQGSRDIKFDAFLVTFLYYALLYKLCKSKALTYVMSFEGIVQCEGTLLL